jgi:hypothetical protein
METIGIAWEKSADYFPIASPPAVRRRLILRESPRGGAVRQTIAAAGPPWKTGEGELCIRLSLLRGVTQIGVHAQYRTGRLAFSACREQPFMSLLRNRRETVRDQGPALAVVLAAIDLASSGCAKDGKTVAPVFETERPELMLQTVG